MAKHSIEDVIPGMVAGRDIVGQDGALLAPRGTTLSEEHLRRMRAYGVRVADVAADGDETSPETDAAADRLAVAQRRCRDLLKPRFQALDRESPFGRALMTNWNFPPALTAMVADHHAPDGQPQSRETAIVHIADILAQAWVWPAFPGPPTPGASEAAWRSLGLAETVLTDVAAAGDARIAEIESLFFGASPKPTQRRSRS